MGQTNKNQLVKEAKSLLAEYNENKFIVDRCAEFLNRKDINPLEAKECDDRMVIARKDMTKSITKYYEKLIHIGKITVEEQLQASFKRFSPAEYIPTQFKSDLIKMIKKHTV